ncbi:TetR/AcrR family transcriptional regulator [Rhodococcus erythropolis]|uniref:TetR/AcrR family transcriptional regulator n=1 Tax=Rhodococcus erythropolis TaxID=1833 RepID=UPI002948ECD5|nr:TetR/AcrR family transcriptional regulator [Rhodococcus erythropolis]MDV6275612.1 TetR/AcrR family transcriptional regulator [Rhodococcus erythropolis]
MARPARPLDPARSRALLDAAGVAFATHGFERASLNSILAEARFPKSSFYHYFGDKTTLFERAVEAGMDALHAAVTPPNIDSLDQHSFWPQIRQLGDQLQIAATSDPRTQIVGLLLHAADVPPSPTLDALRHSITNWLTHALERGRDLGQIDLETPLELQLHLLIAVLTEVDRWVLAHNANTDSTSAALRVLERLLVA